MQTWHNDRVMSLSDLACVPWSPKWTPHCGVASSVNCQKGFVLLDDNCLPRWKNKGGRVEGGREGGRKGGGLPEHKRRNWCVSLSLSLSAVINWMAAGSLSTEREREAAAQTLVARTSVGTVQSAPQDEGGAAASAGRCVLPCAK